MGYIEFVPVTPDQLDVCDNCNNKGLKTSGRTTYDSNHESVLWFCFNCVQKILK